MKKVSAKQLGGVWNAGRHILFTTVAACLIGGAALAQDSGATGDQGYKVGENSQPAQADKSATPDKQPSAEIKRVARFDYVSGKVTWRPDDKADWKKAKTNQTLLEGGQIWVEDGGRAEIRFDDGSLLRVGNGAIVTLKTLFGDAQGDYTEIKMSAGVLTLRPYVDRSVFQVDTPYNTVKTAGPSRVRVGVSSTVEVGVRMGKANVEGKPGKAVVNTGSYLTAQDASASYELASLPKEDSWERWNDERDHLTPSSYPRSGYGPGYYAPGYYAPGPPFFFGMSFGSGYGPYWGHGGWRR